MSILLDARSESTMIGLMPEFVELIRAAHADFAKQTGSTFTIVSGLRTYPQQDALFYSCHLPDGRRDPSKPWKTNAKGGYSNHNFGMAVDVVPDGDPNKPGLQPDWETSHPVWKTLIACMKKQGMQWGGDWSTPDMDHFQYGLSPVTPTQADRDLMKVEGIQAVWAKYRANPKGIQNA